MITVTTKLLRRNPIQLTLASLATALLLVACGGGSGGGGAAGGTTGDTTGGITGPLVTITGVAIGTDGQPLVSSATATSSFLSRIRAAGDLVTVTLKDSNGTLVSATVNSQGEYTIEKAGLVPPYLLKVQRGSETPLYAVSSVDVPTTINISPLTSQVVEGLLEQEGKSAKTVLAAAYGSGEKIAIPTPAQVAIVKEIVKNTLETALQQMGASAEAIDTALNGLDETADKTVVISAVQAAPKVTETNDGTVVETLIKGEETCTRTTIKVGTQKNSTLECKKGTTVTVSNTDVATIVPIDDLADIRAMLDGLAVAMSGNCSDLVSDTRHKKLLELIDLDFLSFGEDGPTRSARWSVNWCTHDQDPDTDPIANNKLAVTFDLEKIARTEGAATYLGARVNLKIVGPAPDNRLLHDVSFGFGEMSITKKSGSWKLYGDRKVIGAWIENAIGHHYIYNSSGDLQESVFRQVKLYIRGSGFTITLPTDVNIDPAKIYTKSNDDASNQYQSYHYTNLDPDEVAALAGKTFTVAKADKKMTLAIPSAPDELGGRLTSLKAQDNADTSVIWQNLADLQGKNVVLTFDRPRFVVDYANIYVSCRDGDSIDLDPSATTATIAIPICSDGVKPAIYIRFEAADGRRTYLSIRS